MPCRSPQRQTLNVLTILALPCRRRFPTYLTPKMVEHAMAHTPPSPLSPSKLTP